MFKELNKLKQKDHIFKKDLMSLLQNLAKTISVHDLAIATAILREEGKYVQKNYREEYLNIYIKYFIMRIKDVKEDNSEYNELIEKKEFVEAIELFESQFLNEKLYKNENDKFPIIYIIITLYTTFILDEPIHPVGTPFPGSLKVRYDNGIYLCPVKDKQSENPNAVCKLCIAKQDDLNHNS
ncbi:MAG: DUF2115 family protein [Methanobacteriaceae archaeon]|jgi:uncharacterized protein (UPF0305 family)|nr:DUF2115 family protein [Candidatus Methanorudis spinitermitis]